MKVLILTKKNIYTFLFQYLADILYIYNMHKITINTISMPQLFYVYFYFESFISFKCYFVCLVLIALLVGVYICEIQSEFHTRSLGPAAAENNLLMVTLL